MKGSGEERPMAPRVRPDIVLRAVADDWVLYDPTSQDLHVLNATAAAVWACCDGTLDAREIAREVASHFPGAPEPEVVTEEVTRALARFREDGLLE